MLGQLNMHGMDKVELAIERLKAYEPPEGYFVAFSGGKDSVVVKALCDMAGVKYDAHYSITTVDPPELVRFVKSFKDVHMDAATDRDGKRITMWNLIPKKKMPPTRIARYCCQYLKESNGEGRVTVTGVRWAESPNRRKNQGGLTIYGKGAGKELDAAGLDYVQTDRGGVVLNLDNADTRNAMELCYRTRKTLINPIIEWEDDDVWEFIHKYNVPYCELYDQGYKRLGCIGCPMNTAAAAELERYPKYKHLYLKAFERMLEEIRASDGGDKTQWKTAEDVMKWWLKQDD